MQIALLNRELRFARVSPVHTVLHLALALQQPPTCFFSQSKDVLA